MEQVLTFEQLPGAVTRLSKKLEQIEKILLQEDSIKEATDQLLTVEEAAEFLRLSTPTIYSKVSRGELPFMKRSKRLYFSKQELTDYIKKGRNKTNAEVLAEADTYLKK